MKMLQPDISINQKFPNSEFHHLHINGQHHMGLYIPTEIHRQNSHVTWKRNKESINKVNKAALLWLCEQSVIEGDQFTPFDKEKVQKKTNQKIVKGNNGRLLLVLRARFVEDFGLKGGEKYCMRNGTGRTLIIDFDCKDEEVDE